MGSIEPISAVTLIRTDTTLDHSQKAEKVWNTPRHPRAPAAAQTPTALPPGVRAPTQASLPPSRSMHAWAMDFQLRGREAACASQHACMMRDHGSNPGRPVVEESGDGRRSQAPCVLPIAAVTTSRINLSPFTKDCRVVVAFNATLTHFLGRFGANKDSCTCWSVETCDDKIYSISMSIHDVVCMIVFKIMFSVPSYVIVLPNNLDFLRAISKHVRFE